MNFSVSLSLRLVECGLGDDQLTVSKAPYLAIQRATWNNYQKDSMERICDSVKVQPTFFGDLDPPHYGVELSDMVKIEQALELNRITCMEKVKPEIWDHCVRTFQRDLIPESEVQTALGTELWEALRPFQRLGVRIAVTQKRFYLADEMGSGKTIQSVAFAKCFSADWPVLIICPSSLRFSIQAEYMQWLKLPAEDIWVVKTGADFAKKKYASQWQNHKILILSYGLLSTDHILNQLIFPKRYQVVVCDEAHYIKSRVSARCKAVRKVVQQAKAVLLMSGTPFSYPEELFAPITMLYPHIYPHFHHYHADQMGKETKFYFATRYCAPQVTGPRMNQWRFRGYDNREELQTVLWTMMLRRRKKDILPQLPSKIRTCITLEPLPDKQQKEIRKLLEQETQSQTDYMQSFRLTCEYKIPRVLDFLKEWVVGDLMAEDPELKVLIFFHHSMMREALEALFRDLGISTFTIDGQVNPQRRNDYCRDFQTNSKYRVGLLSILAAGAGLNLTAAKLSVFAEILFGPEILQAEDRIHRIGQTSAVNLLYLVQPNTTDIINLQLIKKKERESSLILDGQANFLQHETTLLTTGDPLSSVLKRRRDECAEETSARSVKYVGSRERK